MTWQRSLAEEAAGSGRDEPGVESVVVTGSLADAGDAQVDEWSDVDVRVVSAAGGGGDVRRWVARFGTPWAVTTQADAEEHVHRVVYDDGRRLDVVVVHHRGDAPLAPAPGNDLDEFRQAAALAVVELARNDLLIGTHLALGLVQRCLVQAMVLRDRQRHPWTAEGGMALVREVAEVHDELAAQLDSSYRADWSGLDTLLRQAGG